MVSETPTFTAPFVPSDTAALGAALVVRPVPAIEALAPLQGEPGSVYDRAAEQHESFIAVLRLRGVRVVVSDADPASPGTLMPADLAVLLRDGAVLMRPSDPALRPEVARMEATLATMHIPILGRIEAPGLLDGGDVMVGDDTVYVALPYNRASTVGIARAARGNELGRRQFAAIASSAGLRCTDVKLASDVRRLRAVAALLDRRSVLLAREVVDASAFDGFNVIEAPPGEAYGAGVLATGPRRVIANVRFRTLCAVLQKARVNVKALDLYEFGKAGVTPSLMALALKRT